MRAFVKLFLIFTWVCACFSVAVLLGYFGAQNAKWRVIMACYRGLKGIIGLQVTVRGEASGARPLLLVTNHSTYLDVVVLGSVLPVRFAPKSEIAGWPLIGSICRMTNCVFIDRRPSRTSENRQGLQAALEQGSIVALFPEGTTSDGKHLLPFRSSYFSLAEERFHDLPLTIQPAAIRYTHICGMPIGSAQRPKIAWYGDMALLPHAREMLSLGPIRAELQFFKPVDMSLFNDRKALAAYCQKIIAEK